MPNPPTARLYVGTPGLEEKGCFLFVFYVNLLFFVGSFFRLKTTTNYTDVLYNSFKQKQSFSNTTIMFQHKTDLRSIFDKYGEIEQISAMRDYSFVQMVNVQDAEKAVDGATGTDFEGKKLNVEFSRGKREQKTNCFNCGKDGHWQRYFIIIIFVSGGGR